MARTSSSRLSLCPVSSPRPRPGPSSHVTEATGSSGSRSPGAARPRTTVSAARDFVATCPKGAPRWWSWSNPSCNPQTQEGGCSVRLRVSFELPGRQPNLDGGQPARGASLLVRRIDVPCLQWEFHRLRPDRDLQRSRPGHYLRLHRYLHREGRRDVQQRGHFAGGLLPDGMDVHDQLS